MCPHIDARGEVAQRPSGRQWQRDSELWSESHTTAPIYRCDPLRKPCFTASPHAASGAGQDENTRLLDDCESD